MNLTVLHTSYKWNIYLFMTDLFPLTQCLQGSFMLYHVSEFPSFLRLNNIPLYVYTTFCLSSPPLIDTWVVSTFCFLWIMLVWTLVYKYLFEALISILWGTYPEVELLNHVVFPCLIFLGNTIMFLICLSNLVYSRSGNYKSNSCLL